MTDIKAIETVFDGHRFRSRLEARWAVFFKELELPYEYELEGFEVGDGVRYLPDFFLPGLDVHVEVKPNCELARKDLEKLIRFGVDCEQQLLLIIGSPSHEEMYLVNRCCADSWSTFSESASDEELREAFFEGVVDWAHVEFGRVPRQPGIHLVYKSRDPMWDANVTMALAKAKRARFEHGRSGN